MDMLNVLSDIARASASAGHLWHCARYLCMGWAAWRACISNRKLESLQRELGAEGEQ